MNQPWLDLGIDKAAWDAIPDSPLIGRRKPRQGQRLRRPRIVHRTRLAQSGYLPPIIAVGFTPAEIAVLTVIAMEVRARGYCALPLAEIGFRANACRTTVQNAIYWAARWGWILVKQRKVAANRNLPNIIRIIARAWVAWLRLRPGPTRYWGGGFRNTVGSPVQGKKSGLAIKKGYGLFNNRMLS